ncbi:MAG: UDP-N-acetylglucosamine--N-acetylmuramyl-(pentapeptide) pyrophosphoryl-undecaprenol N-acetylglucosamine transferase [Patescibacteria group bacterium]
MKVMLTGGGTLGPVTPLLAVVEAWRRRDQDTEFTWVGTPHGPERAVVEQQGLKFHPLFAPKLDRYAPLRWVLIPFQLGFSFYRAWQLLKHEQPDVLVTAGGYVSVPLLWAGKLMGIPSWVHQQDVRPGLANVLMAKVATKISCAWSTSAKKFPRKKTIHLGNPVRSSVFGGSRDAALAQYGFDGDRPTVLALGGGTGSLWLNQAIASIAPNLAARANILHITGKGKAVDLPELKGHFATELIVDGMADAYAMADLIVCRAGMGTISELSLLHKPAIVVPIPDSHQEDNTSVLAELDAAVILHQKETTPQVLLETINHLLDHPDEAHKLGARLHTALPTEGVAEKLVEHIRGLIKQ